MRLLSVIFLLSFSKICSSSYDNLRAAWEWKLNEFSKRASRDFVPNTENLWHNYKFDTGVGNREGKSKSYFSTF